MIKGIAFGIVAGLGGGFAIYPNERESFESILDWTYAP